MGRPEKPILVDGPVTGFAQRLRELRQDRGKGRKYQAMAVEVGMSPAALSTAANGYRLPSWPCTEAYIRACGVTEPEEVALWRKEWETARAQREEIRKRLREMRRVPRPRGPAGGQPAPPTGAGPGPAWARTEMPESASVSLGHLPGAGNVLVFSIMLPAFSAIGTAATESRSAFLAPAALDTAQTMDKLVDLLTEIAGTVQRQGSGESGRDVNLPLLTSPTVVAVLSGQRRPTLGQVLQIINACGATADDLEAWDRTWHRIESADLQAWVGSARPAVIDRVLDVSTTQAE